LCANLLVNKQALPIT